MASKEEVAKLLAQVQDFLKEDRHVLLTKEDYNRYVDEKLSHRVNEFVAASEAKFVAEFVVVKVVADGKHAAELVVVAA
jgi:hypothetical protein